MGAGNEILSLGTELVNCYICFESIKFSMDLLNTLWVWKELHFRQFAVFFVEIANFNKDHVAHGYFIGFVHNLLISTFRFFGKFFFFNPYTYTYFKEV